ncbi:unnamed protein product [Durusdinium trenchii]|uniref:Kinesin-like protein n=1 Tax=Durusdinium trenchii TaxID=1381693 RepID=A0ABP0QFZ9_9DINO
MAAGEAVVVGVRVRPFNDRENNLNAVVCIDMEGPTTRIRNIDTGDEKTCPFTFDESFWSHDGFEDDGTGYLRPLPNSKYADQRYVFDTFGQRVLDNAWNGFHCCLFAYGQTGAGKSYSMVGYGNNKGIVPISCEEIFRRIGQEKDPQKRYEVTVSMIEIYNEAIQDLLIDVELRPKKGLEVRESKALGIYIDGVIKRPVESYEAIETTIEEATNHRTVGSTLMNATSSRAHTVQIIEFKAVKDGSATVSMINLVDLAGSEKAGQTGATGDRLKEGSMINKSLSALGNVIEKLADRGSEKKKNVLIPYRDSKLTRLLQNALGGSSKTIMICALSPASSNHEETLSTLRYADRAKKIKNIAVPNENPQERLMRELREENEKFKKIFEAMQGGTMPSADEIKEMGLAQQEIAAMEGALAELNKSWEDKVAESREQQEAARMRRSSVNGVAALKKNLQPMMVNLNEDKTLVGRVRFSFPPGRTLIGGLGDESDSDSESGSESDSDSSTGSQPEGEKSPEEMFEDEDESPHIELGEGVARRHAVVFHDNDQNLCTIYAASEEGLKQTFVNGKSLRQLLKSQGLEEVICRQKDKPEAAGIELSHADTLVFGRHFFVFVDHMVCAPEILIASGQVDYAQAKREWQMEQLSGVHESLIVATRGGVLGVSHVMELAEKDEIIESQKAEIAELKQQMVTMKAELDRYKKMAGGRLAAGANMLGELYADELLESQMDEISKDIQKTFKDAIDQMNDVQAIFSKKALREGHLTWRSVT